MNLKQRSKGGVWYAHFTGPNGERLRITTGTTDEGTAQLKALELMREHLVDALPENDARRGSLETLSSMLRDAWHKRWSANNSAKDLKPRIARISREIGHWPRSAVTYDRLETWLNSLTVGKKDPQPLSNASKNRYVSAISTAFTVARKRDATLVIPEFPSWPENNVKERYLMPHEERRIIEFFADHTAPAHTERVYLSNLFLVLLDTGMRASEALEEMTESSILPSLEVAKSVHLRHGCTKSGKGRMVPLTVRARAAIMNMLASPHHGHWTSQNAGRQFRRVMLQLGIKDVTLHTLRHTCASRLVQAGVDLYLVMTWLGHSSMVITQRYAHLAPDTLTSALNALEKVSQADVPTPSAAYPVREAHPASDGTQKPRKLFAVK
jgi:integrase